jgi:opacity protein-like surface antigen
MKKTLLAIALAVSGVASVSSAFAQDSADSSAKQGWNSKSGWYIDGDLGVSRANNRDIYRDTNYTGGLTGGYRWAVSPDMSIGAELGYVYLGKLDARSGVAQNYAANGGTGDTRSNLRGATLGADLRWNFSPIWYVDLRGGAFDAHGSSLSNDAFQPVNRSFSNNLGYYAGVGTGWDINQHWSVGVDYTYYQVSRSPKLVNNQFDGTRVSLDTNTLTAKVEYRF